MAQSLGAGDQVWRGEAAQVREAFFRPSTGRDEPEQSGGVWRGTRRTWLAGFRECRGSWADSAHSGPFHHLLAPRPREEVAKARPETEGPRDADSRQPPVARLPRLPQLPRFTLLGL